MMNFFEDILKNRLQDATSREGVDMDDLWADIDEALPREKASKNSRKLYLLLLLLFISGGASWLFLSDFSLDNLSHNEADFIAPEKESNVSQTPITAEENLVDVNVSITTIKEEKTTKASTKTEAETTIALEKVSSKSKAEKTETTLETKFISTNSSVFTQSPSNQKLLSQAKITNQNIGKKSTLFNNKQDNTSKNLRVQNQLSQQITPTELLKNKMYFISIVQEQDLSDLALPINPLIKPQEKKKKSNINIGVYTGLNTVKNLFENTAKGDILQNAYKVRLGYSVGTEVQYKLNKKLTISAGLEYSQTTTQFNFVQESDGFTDNPNTTIVDENEVRAKIVRTVRHHNHLDFLTLPLMVSMHKAFGKFELGIGTGLGLNAPIKQGGVSLNSTSEIANYYPAPSNIPAPYGGIFITYHLRPFVQFQASEKLSLQIRPDLRYNLYGNSEYFELKHAALMSGLNFGLSFKL